MSVHARLKLHFDHRQSTAADISQKLLSLFGGPNPVDIFQLQKNKKKPHKGIAKSKNRVGSESTAAVRKGTCWHYVFFAYVSLSVP